MFWINEIYVHWHDHNSEVQQSPASRLFAQPFIQGQIKENIKAPCPGGRLNKKDGLTRYGDSHVKDKTS